ncbi:MAG: Na/Pi cotransporter family protein [Acidimicrobiia bacterium]|nr:Na/Pi cotransporter family protein [Acidimicrobiia bacterium]
MSQGLLLGVAESAVVSDDIDTVLLVITLAGGLALFLLGLDRLTESLRLIAGSGMRKVLRRLTANTFMGALTGAGVTAIIQSSSVTTVLVVGFITSGLMTLEQSIGVIMGANVGTTVTAQIIAFDVSRWALAIVAVGFGTSFFSSNDDRKTWGALIMGLGLVFFGMGLMADAMEPLRTYEPFIDFMARMENPLLGIVAAGVFTALVQSSSATTGIVIVLASQGLVTLDSGIALIFGANIGTSVTAQLAAIGKPREARQAAMVHTLFNTVGVLIWIPLIGILGTFVDGVGGGLARELANAHTVFNVINLMVFIWFTGPFAAFVRRIVPVREEEDATVRARYLDRELLRTPPLALDRARLELLRVSDRVRVMLGSIMPALMGGTRSELGAIEDLDDEVDDLHGQIVTYLGAIGQTKLDAESSDELVGLMEATNGLEAIGDIIETNLVQLGLSRIEQGLVVSDETREVLTAFHHQVEDALGLAMMALTQKSAPAARQVSRMKEEINSMEREATLHQADRLVVDAPNRVANYRFEVDVLAHLKRIYYFAKRMARVAVPESERAKL